MKFSTIFAAAVALSPSVMALAVPEAESDIVTRNPEPEALPLAEAEANLFGSGCAYWDSSCRWNIFSYFVGSAKFNIYSQWGHVCNMVKYGQSWKIYSEPLWGHQNSLGWENTGAFAQSGFQLFAYANFNINGGWYGTSKTKWLGFCNDLWNNHYKPKKDCSHDQWQKYCDKWGIKGGSSCHY